MMNLKFIEDGCGEEREIHKVLAILSNNVTFPWPSPSNDCLDFVEEHSPSPQATEDASTASNGVTVKNDLLVQDGTGPSPLAVSYTLNPDAPVFTPGFLVTTQQRSEPPTVHQPSQQQQPLLPQPPLQPQTVLQPQRPLPQPLSPNDHYRAPLADQTRHITPAIRNFNELPGIPVEGPPSGMQSLMNVELHVQQRHPYPQSAPGTQCAAAIDRDRSYPIDPRMPLQPSYPPEIHNLHKRAANSHHPRGVPVDQFSNVRLPHVAYGLTGEQEIHRNLPNQPRDYQPGRQNRPAVIQPRIQLLKRGPAEDKAQVAAPPTASEVMLTGDPARKDNKTDKVNFPASEAKPVVPTESKIVGEAEPKSEGCFFIQFGDYLPEKDIRQSGGNGMILTGAAAISTGKTGVKASPAVAKPSPAAVAEKGLIQADAKSLSSQPVAIATTPGAPISVKVPTSNKAPEATSLTTSAKATLPTQPPPRTNGVAKTPPLKPQANTSSPHATSAITLSPMQSSTSPVSAPPVISPPPPPVIQSWAKLFTSTSSTSASKPMETAPPVKKEEIVELVSNGSANEVGDILANLQISQTAVPIQARRLINLANWCYVNATLQALMACPPFYHLLKALPSFPALSREKSVTPVLDAMVEFANQFNEMKPERFDKQTDKGRKKRDLRPGDPFEPTSVYDALSVMKTSDNTFQRGKQEDAEEFLTCLLNKIHEEIGETIKQNEKRKLASGITNGHESELSSNHDNSDDGKDWEQVGPRNKSVVTHSNVDKTTTLISQIFGGLLRSSLSTGGSNKETAVLEPFFTVPLNVEANNSVEDALKAFVSKESIDGYTCPQTKQELDAHRRLTFEQLPPILILHLKCFVYDKHGGSQKVMHKMNFSDSLEFDRELLSSHAKHHLKRSYKLFAVVYHSGTKTTGGHYHTDVFHTGVRNWVRFDDNKLSQITLSQVFDWKHPCVPYLLYYKRTDMMQPNSHVHKAGATNSI